MLTHLVVIDRCELGGLIFINHGKDPCGPWWTLDVVCGASGEKDLATMSVSVLTTIASSGKWSGLVAIVPAV